MLDDKDEYKQPKGAFCAFWDQRPASIACQVNNLVRQDPLIIGRTLLSGRLSRGPQVLVLNISYTTLITWGASMAQVGNPALGKIMLHSKCSRKASRKSGSTKWLVLYIISFTLKFCSFSVNPPARYSLVHIGSGFKSILHGNT